MKSLGYVGIIIVTISHAIWRGRSQYQIKNKEATDGQIEFGLQVAVDIHSNHSS